MNNKLSIALCQMMTGPSKTENLARADKMIEQACQRDVDLIILPEVFNSPYQADLFPAYAEPYPGPTTEFLSRTAREKGVAIVGGSIIEQSAQGKLYNSSFVFDEHGNLLGRHRKIHLFDVDMPGRITFKESDTLSPGNNITLFEFHGIRIGLLICYDIRFPEVSRALALAGADLLIVPAAFNHTSGPLFWELMMRSRAVDQQLYVAAAAPATNQDALYHAWGNSLIVDPWGRIIARADDREQIVFAELDFSVNEEIRREIPLYKHRRTDLYELKSQSVGKIENIQED
ncbi:nitrilase/cyanide hydratase and apolipoprotein n-acyltransferase [hydrocarbon metagenome]|uniref:Nitrilase/cyanide hydratase and apolipoprotein n-acyltransferase n=1 Tax=hydrocarbon metagenome TaxID=938273 RepID=A0A0W8E7V0_9ZZZZ